MAAESRATFEITSAEHFPDDVQERIRRSRWWERSITEIAQEVPAMVASLGDGRRHPLLRESGGSES